MPADGRPAGHADAVRGNTDVLDLRERHFEDELALARASLVEAARALLADESFWP